MKMHHVRLVTLLGLSLLTGASHGAGPTLNFVTQSFAPFSYEEAGRAAGPTVEIMQAICDKAAVSCQFSVVPWRRAMVDVEDGLADGLFPILPDSEREKTYIFSNPLVATAYSFFVPANSNWVYKSPADLSGMTIGVFGPSGTANTLQGVVAQSKDVRTELELNNLTAFRKLLGGRYGERAAVIANRDVGRMLLKQENIGEGKLAGDLKPISYSFGMSRKKSTSAAQIAALNKALGELHKSGKIKEILDQYGLETVAAKK